MNEIAGMIRSRDHAAALAALLADWRENRDPFVGAFIETLSTAVARPPIIGNTRHARQKAWLALANDGDDADVARLIDCLDGFGREQLLVCAADMADWLPDPRIATAAIDRIRAPADGLRGQLAQRLWRKIFALVGVNADARHVALLRKLGDDVPAIHSLTSLFRAEIEVELATALKQRPPDDPREMSALYEAFNTSTPTTGRAETIAELFAAVYENPEDDGPRAVLADALLEVGDPRGELIVLQLQGASGATQKRRVRELLAGYKHKWLGRLEPAARRTGIVYERGFASGLRVSSDGVDLEALIGLPEWKLLTQIDVGHVRENQIALVRGLVRLKVLTGAQSRLIPDLDHPALEELEVKWVSGPELDLLTKARFPSLRRLELQISDGGQTIFEPLWRETHVGEQLEALEVTSTRYSRGELYGGWLERCRDRRVPARLVVSSNHHLALRLTVTNATTVQIERVMRSETWPTMASDWPRVLRSNDLGWVRRLVFRRFWSDESDLEWRQRIADQLSTCNLGADVLRFR